VYSEILSNILRFITDAFIIYFTFNGPNFLLKVILLLLIENSLTL